MRLERLKLRDFRNYERLEAEFPPGVIVIRGPNGAGKSNLLEAVHYLSYLKSFRHGQERDCVRFGAPLALVEANLADDALRPFDARLVLKGGQRYVRLNGQDVTRFGDFIGRLHSQFFFPGDLALVTGDPGLRREVLDLELLRLKPALAPVYQQYHHALRERNRLLKLLHPAPGQRRNDPALSKALDTYTQQLVKAGAVLIRERRGLVRVLNELYVPLYAGLAPPPGRHGSRRAAVGEGAAAAGVPKRPPEQEERVELRYISGIDPAPDAKIAESLAQRLADAAEREASLRFTTAGPHRDELGFILNGAHDLKRYGSQGQIRSAALCFRLALAELSRQRLSDSPILLLDDALSEMDDPRKQRLLALCTKHTQVFITSASEREAALIAPQASAVYEVSAGRVGLLKS